VPPEQARSPAFRASACSASRRQRAVVSIARWRPIRRCNSKGALIRRQAQNRSRCPGQAVAPSPGLEPQPSWQSLYAHVPGRSAHRSGAYGHPKCRVLAWTRSRAGWVKANTAARGGRDSTGGGRREYGWPVVTHSASISVPPILCGLNSAPGLVGSTAVDPATCPLRSGDRPCDRYPGWSGNLVRRWARVSRDVRRISLQADGTVAYEVETISIGARGQGCGQGPDGLSYVPHDSQMTPVATPGAGLCPRPLGNRLTVRWPWRCWSCSGIVYPGHWGLFGGHLEATRTPEQGPALELKERNQRENPGAALWFSHTTASEASYFLPRACRCP